MMIAPGKIMAFEASMRSDVLLLRRGLLLPNLPFYVLVKKPKYFLGISSEVIDEKSYVYATRRIYQNFIYCVILNR